MSHLDRFPKLSDAQYHAMLQPPSAPVRCVIDTDTRNEIDDQFALAWALLSRDQLQIEAIYAAPYSFQARMRKFVRRIRFADARAKRRLGSETCWRVTSRCCGASTPWALMWLMIAKWTHRVWCWSRPVAAWN